MGNFTERIDKRKLRAKEIIETLLDKKEIEISIEGIPMRLIYGFVPSVNHDGLVYKLSSLIGYAFNADGSKIYSFDSYGISKELTEEVMMCTLMYNKGVKVEGLEAFMGLAKELKNKRETNTPTADWERSHDL